MTLQTLKADSPLDIILDAVHRDGACILKDVLDPAQVPDAAYHSPELGGVGRGVEVRAPEAPGVVDALL